MEIISCSFKSNYAFKNAPAIYIKLNSGIISIFNCNFSLNQVLETENNLLDQGSLLYLVDPGDITIQDSNFSENTGILGGCIYYSETNENRLIELNGNIFINNKAKLAGGAIYMEKHYQRIDPFFNNTFRNNLGLFGNDVSSPPFKMIMSYDGKILFQKLTKSYLYKNIVPGISSINLNFIIVDYYEQEIISLDQGYSLLYVKDSKNLTRINDSSIKIDGITSASIINGK